MKLNIVQVVCILGLFTMIGRPAFSQDPAEQQENETMRMVESLDAMLDPSTRIDQMTKMLVSVFDGYLDYLARPKTAEKLAAFQKNYYDALIKNGFSKNQAFQLVRDMGNPLRAMTEQNSK